MRTTMGAMFHATAITAAVGTTVGLAVGSASPGAVDADARYAALDELPTPRRTCAFAVTCDRERAIRRAK